MNTTKENTSTDHPQKIAVDAFGGDPLAPGDSVLEKAAEVVKGGEKDEIVSRWATAFKTVCPDPNKPRRLLLAAIANAVDGEANDTATQWAESQNFLLAFYKLEN